MSLHLYKHDFYWLLFIQLQALHIIPAVNNTKHNWENL